MEQLFVEIVNRGLTASLLVLVILLIRLVFRSAPKRFWCVLWALVGFRLLCPVSLESAFSLMPDMDVLWQDAGEGHAVNKEREAEGTSVNLPLYPENFVIGNEVIGPGKIAKENLTSFGGGGVRDSRVNSVADQKEQDFLQNSITDQDVSKMPDPRNWQNKRQTVAVCLWLTGLTAMLIYGVRSYFKVKQQVKVSLPMEKQCSEVSGSQRTVFGRIKDGERIYYCDSIETPFAFGMFRPGIYLPSGLDASTVEYVIRHEEEHLKCKDQWWKGLGFLLLAMYWFHPLLWVAYLLFCRDLEYACDERVIHGMEEEQRKNYAEALLNCSIGKRAILFCPTAFGETSVKGRIKSVLAYKKATVPVVLCTLVLALVVAVVFLTDPRNESAKMNAALKQLECSTMSIDDSRTNPKLCCFSDNPVLERVALWAGTERADAPEQLVALERWDGENWRMLSEGGWQEASYAIKNGNMWKVDLTKEWQQYGEGLYRIVWNAASPEAEPCYYATELRIIDIAHIEDRDTVEEIFLEKGKVTNIITDISILTSSLILPAAEQGEKVMSDYILGMECVGLQEISFSFGSNPNDSMCVLYLSGGETLRIRSRRGKTLDGQEYSAICTYSGLDREILLYSGEKTFLEAFQEQKKWISPTPPPGPDDCLPYATMIDGNLVNLTGSFTPIISVFQNRIDQAEYLGQLRNVPGNEFPKEELESNCFAEGCKLYYYQDERIETYIVLNPEETECFFAMGWAKYTPGYKKIEERIVDIFPTPVPSKLPEAETENSQTQEVDNGSGIRENASEAEDNSSSKQESISGIIKVYYASEKEGRLETYYELADETWKTEEHHYQYRIELTGRMHNAASDSTFVCLSNSEEISFSEVAWSMLSSNLADHLDRAEVVLVELH